MNDKRKYNSNIYNCCDSSCTGCSSHIFVIKSAKNEAKGSSQMTETATEDSSDKDEPAAYRRQCRLNECDI